MRFQTDWIPSGEHAMYYGAWSKGIYAKHGIDITITRGYGTLHLGDQTMSGHWHNGCLAVGGRVVAIGVPRTSCMAGEDRPMRSAQQEISQR